MTTTNPDSEHPVKQPNNNNNVSSNPLPMKHHPNGVTRARSTSSPLFPPAMSTPRPQNNPTNPTSLHATSASMLGPPVIHRATTTAPVFHGSPTFSGNYRSYPHHHHHHHASNNNNSRSSHDNNNNNPWGSLSRRTSATTGTSSASASQNITTTTNDWRANLSIEERQALRAKVRRGYVTQCLTYEDLLETVAAIEEEMIHATAPSRLDYFKSGFEFEKRIKLKREQLSGRTLAENNTQAKAMTSSSTKLETTTEGPFRKKQRVEL